jgi:hypothetical protein
MLTILLASKTKTLEINCIRGILGSDATIHGLMPFFMVKHENKILA